MKDVFNRLFSGLLVAVDVPVSPFFCFCHDCLLHHIEDYSILIFVLHAQRIVKPKFK
jgi:hypothetical protein